MKYLAIPFLMLLASCNSDLFLHHTDLEKQQQQQQEQMESKPPPCERQMIYFRGMLLHLGCRK
jgi:hypothetical protein